MVNGIEEFPTSCPKRPHWSCSFMGFRTGCFIVVPHGSPRGQGTLFHITTSPLTPRNILKPTWFRAMVVRKPRHLRPLGDRTSKILLKYLGDSRGSMHINTLILTDQYKQYNTMLYSQINTMYIHELLVGGIPTPVNNMSSSAGMMIFQIYGKS